MSQDFLNPMSHRSLAISTSKLRKTFRDQIALRDLDLRVPENSIYVLVGPNGAGKTTALKSVLGIVSIDSGSLEAFGLQPATEGAKLRAQIGYIPDDPRFGYGEFTIGALLNHHSTYFPNWDQGYADHLCDALEVTTSRTFGAASKGQARRVQLVLALSHRPTLLLLDEPTDGLDPLIRDRFLELLTDHIASTPTTVLWSTHLPHEAEGLADCLGVLDRGRLIAQAEQTALDINLHRVIAETDDDWWTGAKGVTTIRQHRRGREISTVVWARRDQIEPAFEGAGATVRAIERLSLEDAARAFLAMEKSL